MKTLIEKYDVWRKEYHPMALMNEAMAEAAWIAAYGEAMLAEREACAKVCDELPAPDIYSHTDKSMWDVTCMDCAAAIRARGQA